MHSIVHRARISSITILGSIAHGICLGMHSVTLNDAKAIRLEQGVGFKDRQNTHKVLLAYIT